MLADILDKVCQGVVSPKGYARFLLITVSNLSQASPLGGLSPPHDAFQGHAAHPPRWFGELSPKGSSGYLYTLRAISPFSFAAFTAHAYETTNRRAWLHGRSDNRCRHRSDRPGLAIPLAAYRCAGGPSGCCGDDGVCAMQESPSGDRVGIVLARPSATDKCPARDALGRVAKQDACGPWQYARAAPWGQEHAGHHAEQGGPPAADRCPPHAVRAREGCAITLQGYHH